MAGGSSTHATRELFHIPYDEEDSTFDIGDITHKRSGIHNLNRTGYHEDKCRNVLVRYCAHIPRNYQYKDGVQQIFLILREHLGDENLDLAGGVLYELIEVDCEHTDDPGAAFQRWKHDHLRRYADLELPHVPHMTTITSSIIPTKRLSRWRSTHPNRYPFVLSDSSPSTERVSVDPSCIRHRKAWMIDHTLYISSRNEGTRPLNSPNPKEFHERQWDSKYATRGRLIEERDVPISSLDRPSEVSPPGTADNLLNSPSQRKGLQRLSPGFGFLYKLADRISLHKREPGTAQKRRTWRSGVHIFEQTSLRPRDKYCDPDATTVPLPADFQVPNAIFARKYLLVEASESLPESLYLRQMPTAESKATDTIVEAATHGLLDEEQSWSFRGPFTPQLGFDGGLDYQWISREPIITFRRFHVGALSQDATDLNSRSGREEEKQKMRENNISLERTSTKRQGIIFGLGGALEGEGDDRTQRSLHYTTSNQPQYGDQSVMIPRRIDGEIFAKLQQNEASIPDARGDFMLRTSSGAEQKCALRRPDSLLFQNIEFTLPVENSGLQNPTPHRKVTVVELESDSDLPTPNFGCGSVDRALEVHNFHCNSGKNEGVSMLAEPASVESKDGHCSGRMSQEATVERLGPWKFKEIVG
ncbi:hypothetical protein F5B19DRAFT_489707 [Rostrohypoxylon terebratum]|nr:hypothetical protein F5B19DRAFT_489707 [Rostrohypoxylon terebratum]